MSNKIYTVEGKEYLVWYDAPKNVIYATPRFGNADIKIIKNGRSLKELTIRKAISKNYGHKTYQP